MNEPTILFRSIISFCKFLVTKNGSTILYDQDFLIVCVFFYIPIKFANNMQRLQNDATGSIEIYSNFATIEFNI